jgi:hypothetical protein
VVASEGQWTKSVGFHPDGKRVATAMLAREVHWRDLPEWFSGVSSLQTRTWAALGMRMAEDGQIEAIPQAEWARYVDALPHNDRSGHA